MRYCPACGCPVKIVYKKGHAVSYEYVKTETDTEFPAIDPKTAAELRKLRNDKKTVAIVGKAETTCSLAPWDDERVEIWGINEEHIADWMKRANVWLQIHHSSHWKKKPVHLQWLKENPLNIPIVMMHKHDDIPKSEEYPLIEISERFLGKLRRGAEKIKYFSSALDYAFALAVYRGFERIELYGFDMEEDGEYVRQRAGAFLWTGIALGAGVEVYIPEKSLLIDNRLYGQEVW